MAAAVLLTKSLEGGRRIWLGQESAMTKWHAVKKLFLLPAHKLGSANSYESTTNPSSCAGNINKEHACINLLGGRHLMMAPLFKKLWVPTSSLCAYEKCPSRNPRTPLTKQGWRRRQEEGLFLFLPFYLGEENTRKDQVCLSLLISCPSLRPGSNSRPQASISAFLIWRQLTPVPIIDANPRRRGGFDKSCITAEKRGETTLYKIPNVKRSC